MHLSRKQAHLLRKINKTPVRKSLLNETEVFNLSHLSEGGFIRYETLFEDDSSLNKIDTVVHITPKGKAELDYMAAENLRWLIPVIVSLAALVVSILAIVSSSQSVYVHFYWILKAAARAKY